MWKKLLIASALCVFPLANSGAEEGELCGPREPVINGLHHEYGEKQLALGMLSPGIFLEIWYNPETRTATVIRTYGQEMTCLMAAVTDLYLIPPQLEAPKVKEEKASYSEF